MAFVLDNLENVRGSDKQQRVHGIWMYRTTDARATVLAADYFLTAKTLVPSTDTTTTTSTKTQSMAGKFYIGDVIMIQQVSDETDYYPVDSYRVIVVQSVTGSSATVLVEELMEGEIVAVGQLADISTASNVDIDFGTEVELTKATTYLGGTITVSDAVLTIKEDSSSGTAVDGGSITVTQSGSVAGDKDTASPYANRTATTFNVATDGASTGTQTVDIVLRGIPTKGKVEIVRLNMLDISSSSTNAVACPYSGTVVKIVSTLQAVISGGDAAITTKIGTTAAGATNITGGALTIANSSSAIGDIDSTKPSAANTIAEGELLVAVSDGGSTNTAALYMDFYILRS